MGNCRIDFAAIKLIIYVWTVDSIVSITAIYFDFEHRLSRLNLMLCVAFFQMEFFYCPSPLRRAANGSQLVNHFQPTVPRHLLRLQRATEHACCRRLLLSCRAAEHVQHDLNEISNLPAHALPARRTANACAARTVIIQAAVRSATRLYLQVLFPVCRYLDQKYIQIHTNTNTMYWYVSDTNMYVSDTSSHVVCMYYVCIM